MNRYLIGLGALLAITACGGGDETPPKNDTQTPSAKPADSKPAEAKADKPAPKTDKVDWAASMGTATVSGTVAFEGTAPTPAAIDTSSDAQCTVAITDETLVVKGGKLANVIISVSKGLDGYKFAKGTGDVALNQHGCRYIPHAIAMQAGQNLKITNEDNTVHNVHSFSKRNQGFNKAQPAGAAPIEAAMTQKDKLFPVKCDMHAWMSCNVAVFDHPFFAVSDADGKFSLPKLPAGEYTLTAEHEVLGKQEATVTVAANGSATTNFSFKQ